MKKNSANLLNEVATYYGLKLSEHGETPQGVDWNGEASQLIRFEQLCKIINQESSDFSVNDLGCGYGALFDYLKNKHSNFSYLGFDISPEMIAAATRRYNNVPNASFNLSEKPDKISHYSIASGIFNVRLEYSDLEWMSYIEQTLDVLNSTSNLGFAFNCLTSYSDQDKMRSYLYYADPGQLFDLCKRRYSRQVALLHDYELYEFTILVRKKNE